MTDDSSHSLSSLLALGALTTLVNQSMTLVDGADEQFDRVDGLVVRIRIERPSLVLYVLLHHDGIEFLQVYEGPVDVRIRAPLGALLQYLLLPEADESTPIHVQASEQHLMLLNQLIEYCSFGAVARGWLDRYVRFNDILGILGREDPSWLLSLRGLPDDIRVISNELAEQRLLQEDLLAEMTHLRRQLGRQRQLDMVFMVVGLILLFASLATLSGNLPQWLMHQAILLGSLGGALLLSRLVVSRG